MSEAPGTGPGAQPPSHGPEGPQPPEQPAGAPRPPRYPRTTNGLIGSLVVTLLVIGGFVALRAFSRDNPEVTQPPIDYLSVVSEAQDGGFGVLVYPGSLPKGWVAYSLDYVPGQRHAWGLSMHTADGHFVGLRQEDAPLDDLLHTYVDEDPAEGGEVDVPGSVAPTWRTFSDSGGDHAYAAEVAGDEVLVFGSASTEDQRRLLELLSTAKR